MLPAVLELLAVPFLVVQAVALAAVLALAVALAAVLALAAALLPVVPVPVVHLLLALHTLYRILLPLLWDFHICYKTFFIPSQVLPLLWFYFYKKNISLLPMRCLRLSYEMIVADAAAFRLSTLPSIGILSSLSAFLLTFSDRPAPSFPIR